MSLSQNLINQFVKVVNYEEKQKKETTVNAVYKEIDGVKYVQIDGSDIWTPVTAMVEAEDGDRVKVSIKNHTATITGNITNPSASSTSVQNIKDTVDDNGNTIKQINNSIQQQNNSIIQLDNSIKQVNNTITQYDNTIQQQNNKIQQFDNEIIQQNNKIDSMNNDIVQHSNQIESINNTITQQNDDITSMNNNITSMNNTIIQQGNTIKQYGTDINTFNSKIQILNSGFKIENGVLTGLSDIIVNNLKTDSLDAVYANIDFSNIDFAAIQKVFSDSGIIRDLVVDEGKITGELVGVTIKGDLIEANSLRADKLVILGEDGLYYKLNVNSLGETTASSDPKYQNGLDGSVIVANSITAEKVNVGDLVAFNATIGGYNITNNSLYSGVKNSVSNTTRGVFLGMDGQFAVGDNNNFLKFFKDTDGTYKLEIKAESIKFGSGGSSIEDEINNTNDNIKDLVKNAEVQYYLSISNTTLSGGSWVNNAPAWADGKYMWSRTKITKQDGTIEYEPSENGTCISGAQGPKGDKGEDAEIPVIEKEITGDRLYINDSSYNPFVKFKINNGVSKQETRSGKNIFNIDLTSKVANSTYTRSGNSITATKTSDGKTTYINFPIYTEKNTDYIATIDATIIDDSTDIGSSQVGVRQTSGSSSWLVVKTLNKTSKSKQHFEMAFNSGEFTTLYFWLYLNNNNSSVGSVQIKYENIMVRKASIEDDTYEIYGVMPSPEFRSEIINITGSINLFDGELEEGHINAITGENENANDRIRSKNFIEIPSNISKICVIRTISGGTFGLRFYDKDKTFMSYIADSKRPKANILWFDVPENTKYIRFIDITNDLSSKIKITTDLCSYKYSEPKKGIIYLKDTCKNLVSHDEIGNYNNAISYLSKVKEGFKTTSNFSGLRDGGTYLKLKKNTQYIVSFEVVSITTTGSTAKGVAEIMCHKKTDSTIFGTSLKANTISSSDIGKRYSFTFNSKDYDFWTLHISGWYGVGYSGVLIYKDLMVEEKTDNITEATEFEDGSIEFEFPLEEGQRLYEGSYLADDGIHHNRKQVILDGTEDEDWDIRSDTHEMRLNLNTYNAIYDSKIYCNEFVQTNSWDGIGEKIRWVLNSQLICIHSDYLNTDNITLDEWKNYLKQNNLIIEFGCKEYIEPYTAAQQEVYNNIMNNARTYNGITNIFCTNDIVPELYAKYYTIYKGSAGNGISSTSISYQASISGVVIPTGEWYSTIPTIPEGQYLWTRTITKYYDGSDSTGYSVSRIGNTGNGISSITEHYQVSTSNTKTPTSWSTTVPKMTATNKYLWNYETINYTDGTTEDTTKRVIGVYGDQGLQGSDGEPGVDLSQGKMLYKDPMFTTGLNNVQVYNLNNNGTVTITRVKRSSDNPTKSDYELLIQNTGDAEPEIGGFSFRNMSRANAIFVYRIIAKIPTGRKISERYNDIGVGATIKWLTSQEGTGKFQEYLFKLTCGSKPNNTAFGSAGFFKINGADGTTDNPVEWRLAYATCFDMTDASDSQSALSIGTEAKDKIDNLDVGGRNLLLDSSNPISEFYINNGISSTDETFKNCSVVKSSAAWGGVRFDFNSHIEERGFVENNDEFTYSIYAKLSENETKTGIRATMTAEGVKSGVSGTASRLVSVQNTLDDPYITKEWKRFYYTFKVPKEYRPEGNGYVGLTRIEQNAASSTDCYVMWACPKLEKGNKPTDWTPAPEDVDDSISNVQASADSAQQAAENAQKTANDAKYEIEYLKEIISTLVTDENGGSLMTQTPDGWTFNMSSITGNIDALKEELTNLSKNDVNINNVISNLSDLLDDVSTKTAYINVTTDDDGNPCIELGKIGNSFKVRITNTAIDFLEGSSTVAYVNNNTFYSNKMIVKSELQIGEGPGFVWKTRSNGNMGLVYIS